jgi:hypothetical protein
MSQTIFLTPAPLDIVAYQGDAFGLVLTLTDPETGQPFNLTGYTAAMHIRADVADRDATPDATATVTVTAPTLGKLEAVVPGATMAALKGTYFYDLEIRDGSGQPSTVVAGRFGVRQETTR